MTLLNSMQWYANEKKKTEKPLNYSLYPLKMESLKDLAQQTPILRRLAVHRTVVYFHFPSNTFCGGGILSNRNTHIYG
jgi:hypothetical protein